MELWHTEANMKDPLERAKQVVGELRKALSEGESISSVYNEYRYNYAPGLYSYEADYVIDRITEFNQYMPRVV